uniref:Transposase n=1 Tax=Streptomyces sp. NBC_00008 TaxID=2903610 RepID=A0AAU2VMK2_9ACTN
MVVQAEEKSPQLLDFAGSNVVVIVVPVSTGYKAATVRIDIATHQARWTTQNIWMRAIARISGAGH